MLIVQLTDLLPSKVDINIFQQGCISLCNKNPGSKGMIHLSYHDNDHYNSVRLASDFSTGRPAPFELQAEGAQSLPPRPSKGWDHEEVVLVMESTGCKDKAVARRHLEVRLRTVAVWKLILKVVVVGLEVLFSELSFQFEHI